MSLTRDGSLALANLLAGRARFRILPTGAGEPRDVSTAQFAALHWATWLPGNQQILVSANEPGHGSRLYVIDTNGATQKAIGPEGTTYEANAVSLDGTRAVARDADQRVMVYSLRDGSATAIDSIRRDETAIGWTADGHEVFVVTPGIPCVVSRVNVTTGARTLWRELMPPDPTAIVRISPVLITPDGQAYAYTYGRFLSTLYEVTGIR